MNRLAALETDPLKFSIPLALTMVQFQHWMQICILSKNLWASRESALRFLGVKWIKGEIWKEGEEARTLMWAGVKNTNLLQQEAKHNKAAAGAKGSDENKSLLSVCNNVSPFLEQLFGCASVNRFNKSPSLNDFDTWCAHACARADDNLAVIWAILNVATWSAIKSRRCVVKFRLQWIKIRPAQ